MTARHPNHRDRSELPAELRRTPIPPGVRDWIERETGRQVRRQRRLPGASSSAVHAVTLSDGCVVVLRRWAWSWLLMDEPVVPRREIDALRVAADARLPAPAVIAADPAGDETGDGVPALLMTKCPGRAVRNPDLTQLARMLARVHSVEAPSFPHTFFRWCMDALDGAPVTARDPKLWREAIDVRAQAMPGFEPRFIHRDYHPGNVLWSRGRLTGIVDWALACVGPWECDVATCRSNLMGLSGPAAADDFLSDYVAITGRQFHPYWDLNYLLENDADHWTASNVEEAEPLLRELLRGIEKAKQ